MSSRLRTIGVASLVAAVAFAFYAVPQSNSPLLPAEIAILRAAQLEDGAWRLFFHAGEEQWLQPIPVYLTAVAGLVASGDAAARYATAAVGAINVALMLVLARRLFSQPLIRYGAALLLMVTPAHFVYARLGTEAIYLLPFVLVWLICLLDDLRDGHAAKSLAGAFALGVGIYSQPSAPLTMAFLLAVGLAAMAAAGRLTIRSTAMPIAAFSLPLLLAGAWFAAHPDSYPDTFGRWAIHAAHLRFPLDAVSAFINWTTLGTRVSLYWGIFDPSWLFFDGPDGRSALRGSAPFLLATAVLLVPGIRWTLTSASPAVTTLLLGGLAVSPLAASTFGEPHAIDRAMGMVLFVVLLAAAGTASAFSHGRRTWRLLAAVALAACAIDFGAFYLSYWR